MTTRAQDALADAVACRYGRSKVMALDCSACVLVVALEDEHEAAHLIVPPDGVGARAATYDEVRRAEERERTRNAMSNGHEARFSDA